MVAFALAFGAEPVMAQEAAAEGAGAVLHLFGAAIGLGMTVIGAALGIGKLAAAAAEGIARQPNASDKITGAVNLPLFLLEGVAILAEVFVLLIVLL
jgi:F-type H+-transporting ATPase subunit c